MSCKLHTELCLACSMGIYMRVTQRTNAAPCIVSNCMHLSLSGIWAVHEQNKRGAPCMVPRREHLSLSGI